MRSAFFLAIAISICSCASVNSGCVAKFHKGQTVTVEGRRMTVHETHCVSRNDTYALRTDRGRIEFYNESEISQ